MTKTRAAATFPSLELGNWCLFEIWCLQFGASALRLAVTVLVTLAVAGPVFAAGGTVVTLPQPGTKIRSGLAMTVDLRGIDSNGYRPVVITVKPLNNLPLPADRVLRVVLAPYAYMSNLAPEVSQVIELPEGSTTTTATIAIPQTAQWHSMSIETIEDGERLRDLSVARIGTNAMGINYWEWSEARPATLIVDPAVPDRPKRDTILTDFQGRGTDLNPTYALADPRLYANLFPDPNRNNSFSGGISDAILLDNLLKNYPRLEMLPPAELPTRWIELSQYDIVMISLADLRALAASEPARLRALADWAAGGPLLIVHGAGSDFAGLAEIEKLLTLPAAGEERRRPVPRLDARPARPAHADDEVSN